MSCKNRIALCVVVLLAAVPGMRADDNVFRALPAAQLEKWLGEQKIEAKKSADGKDEVTFAFKRNKRDVRLTLFGTTDLMLETTFRSSPLESINRWNIQAKFTRATLQKDVKGDSYSVLESNLEVTGGITAGVLEKFLARYDEDLKGFESFLASGVLDTKLLESITDEGLEKVIRELGVTFEKQSVKNGPTVFQFELEGTKLRLRNFGGKDLSIAARFRALPLEDVNGYNLSRKFVRAFSYQSGKDAFTVVTGNLDCTAGVSEGMIRHFILSFAEDARHFGEYADTRQKDQARSE